MTPIKPIHLPNGTTIEGTCDAAFDAVAEAFTENFLRRDELGASVCLMLQGRTVVDLWGGVRDARSGQPWTRDTVAVVFSCTKAATALCAHLLIDRGLLDLDAPVARYWPEFSQAGKEQATVLMALNHTVGLPALRDPVKKGGFHDWDYMVQRLAAEAPFWTPGTTHGYHMTTFGWLVGELVRRVSGKPLGQFFHDEIARPLGLDFSMGLPEADEVRVAPIDYFIPGPDWPLNDFARAVLDDSSSIQHLAVINRGAYNANTREAHAAGIGAAGGIANARALAGLFAPLACDAHAHASAAADNGSLHRLSPERRNAMRAESVASARDETLLIPTRFAQGFMLSMDNGDLPEGNSVVFGRDAFGHVGLGGSVGFADPAAGMAFGYVMNRQGAGILLNRRGQSLIDIAYECLHR